MGGVCRPADFAIPITQRHVGMVVFTVGDESHGIGEGHHLMIVAKAEAGDEGAGIVTKAPVRSNLVHQTIALGRNQGRHAAFTGLASLLCEG